ncbi:efflux RND transporter periplasmic adaptor subunit [Aestuariivirga sp. YIM B02566]|uniref:Efflux RND transporter periplasmic adaptor subunit n=1 Tax=Taklimakanibacter albus TaxID=2800327 RepID=A0ACC5R8W0_9HYPH|nr:efflux RND transporter periplasmic adaptor subunit [Aestuariivirga sp. YIM B02566]MBK1869064.1 efflux RND transporter periplasmic adaptor subunit [Aestuariivirga sp. YIM B02566]
MKKTLVSLFVLALLAGAGYTAQRAGWVEPIVSAATGKLKAAAPQPAAEKRQARPANASPVEVVAAAAKTLSDDITAVGSLLSDESVQIAAETNGRVAEIAFTEGQSVAAGAVLIKLDDKLIAAQLEDAKARLTLAQSTYDRAATLRKSGTASQTTLDTAQSELLVQQAAYDLISTQQEKLSIKAPFPGELGFRSISLGAYVTAGTPLVNLEKIDQLKVNFSVPEFYLSKLAAGQKIDITADALPGVRFEGTIYAIDPAIDVNGRAVRVKATLANQDGKLRPGLLARITVKGQPRTAVTIPESALVSRGEDFLVFKTDNGKAKETKVLAGRRENGFVEILDGIEVGQQVVIAGQSRLRDGSDVEIVPPATAAVEG